MPRAVLTDDPPALSTRTVAPSFAATLRDGTAAVHREAERTGLIADLIRGRATRHGYALLLRNLVPVYTALETALEAHRETPVVSIFADPRLRRLQPLQRDLVALVGEGWAGSCPLLPQAQAYAAAVEAARADAPRLLAHAYARYLGDLSGGQILKPVLARTLGLGPEMLGFYDFPALADVVATKAAIRDAIDAIPADDAAAASIVTEAVSAFRHNIAVSEAVQAAAAD